MKKIALPLLCFLIVSVPVFGQEEEKEFLALKIEKPLQIDGRLDEPVWAKAPDAGVYIQPRANMTDQRKVKTTVKILFDDNFLYFGFLCYDPEPENITAGETENDGDLRKTDSVYILVDILQESKAFLYFATNVAGIRSDGLIPKGGRSVDYRWNGRWTSSCQKTDSGWSAEVVIERSAQSIDPVKSKSIGLSLTRVVPRLEVSIFVPDPLDPAFSMSELRDLRRLELLTAEEQMALGKGAAALLLEEKRIVINPYGITMLESGEKISPALGLDVRYSFSQRMSGWLTAYPDFATVEPDHEQVNLTPFELYLPERRDFFRGASTIPQQPFGLFYSKRIGDIYGGVKLGGQFETYEFSLLSAQTVKDETSDPGSANFSALSFKTSNRAGSLTVGVTAANKLMEGKNEGAAGITARLNVTGKLRISGQFALSYGDYGKGSTAFFLGPSYDSANFHVHLHYRQMGENFGDNANAVGFIPDDNRRELDSAINKAFPLNIGPLEQIRYVSNYNIYWGMDGTLRSWQIDEGLILDLRERRFSFSVVHTMEYKLNEYLLEPERIYIPEKGGWLNLYTYDFRNDRTRICSEFNAGEWQQFSLSLTFGNNYGSHFYMFTLSKKLELTKNLFSEYDLHNIRYKSKSLHNSTYIHVLKLTARAGEKLYGTFFFQLNSDISKANFHVACTYTVLPPYGTVQLIYQKGTGAFWEKGDQGHTLFLKIGYIF